jgi:hypothetical protein
MKSMKQEKPAEKPEEKKSDDVVRKQFMAWLVRRELKRMRGQRFHWIGKEPGSFQA